MSEQFEQWGILELLGHIKVAGRITEEERFGSKLGRIDIPQTEGFVTQYFGASSIYRLTPCTEEIAREVAKRCNNFEPAYAWDLRKVLKIEQKEEAEVGFDMADDADYEEEELVL